MVTSTIVPRLQELPKTGRVLRNPKHNFAIRQRPFEITPFLIAPVLPGETMKNLLIQSRAVTDPIKSPLIGWWMEYFIFYVKHRAMAGSATFQRMMLDTTTSLAAYRDATGTQWTYVADDDVDWTTQCLTAVVNEFFRDDGEVSGDYVITAGRPAARINQEAWWQSVVDRTTILDAIDPVIDQTPTADIKASQIELALRQYEFLRANSLTNMDYEDYLRTFGIRKEITEVNVPELLRYVREWQYPSNTINSSTGVPTSAVSWAVAERADKDRFFPEPGFIFGVTVARPKVYLQAQTGAAVGMLDDAYAWLPAIMNDDPATSLKEITANNGPFQATTHNYVVDLRDLFLWGDQFINFDPASTDANIIGLPNAALTNKKYPASADADELFVAASPANQVRQDGVVSLSILGRQVDKT